MKTLDSPTKKILDFKFIQVAFQHAKPPQPAKKSVSSRPICYKSVLSTKEPIHNHPTHRLCVY